MRKIKKNYSIIAALALLTVIASCKKDSFESIAPAPFNPTDIQQEQVVEEQETGSNERNTGALLLPAMEYDKLPKIQDENTVLSLPSSYYLVCPPIKDQGSEGSCVAFGTAYAARSIAKLYKTGAGGYNHSTNLYSPEYIYNTTKISSSCGSGSYVSTALNKMKNLAYYGGGGVCTWITMPYSSSNGCSTLPNSAQVSNALSNYINTYSTVPINILNIKTQLTLNRAVIVLGPVDTEFQNLGNNQTYTQYHSNHFVANHCYAVVGYSDSKHAFKVMNSWGTNWGTAGYGWIDYDVVAAFLPVFPYSYSTGFWAEAYVITSSN